MTPDEPRRDVTAPRDPEVPPPPDHDCLVSTTGTGNRPIDSAASLTTPTFGHGDQDGECHVRFRFDSVARNDVTSSSCTLPKEPHPVRDQTVYRRAPTPRVEAAEGRGCAEGRGGAKGQGRAKGRGRRGSRPPPFTRRKRRRRRTTISGCVCRPYRRHVATHSSCRAAAVRRASV